MKTEIIKYTTVEEKFPNLPKGKKELLQNTFKPLFNKLSNLQGEYINIIEVPEDSIDEKLQAEARGLRLVVQKMRTSADKIKKELKADLLVEGRAIDSSYKDFEALALEWEGNLSYREKYFDILKQKKIQELQLSRAEKLSKFLLPEEVVSDKLGELEEEIFEALLTNKKNRYSLYIKEQEELERKRQEEEAQKKLLEERRNVLLPLTEYLDSGIPENLATLNQEEFDAILSKAKLKKDKIQKEQIAQKLEIERQKKIIQQQQIQARKEKELLEKKYKQVEADLIEMKNKEVVAIESTKKESELVDLEVSYKEIDGGEEEITWDYFIKELKLLKDKNYFSKKEDIDLKKNVNILLEKIILYIEKNKK